MAEVVVFAVLRACVTHVAQLPRLQGELVPQVSGVVSPVLAAEGLHVRFGVTGDNIVARGSGVLTVGKTVPKGPHHLRAPLPPPLPPPPSSVLER